MTKNTTSPTPTETTLEVLEDSELMGGILPIAPVSSPGLTAAGAAALVGKSLG